MVILQYDPAGVPKGQREPDPDKCLSQMPKAYEPKMRRDRATPRTSFARRRAIRLPERNCFLARRRRAEHMGENLTYRDSAGGHPRKRKRCAATRLRPEPRPRAPASPPQGDQSATGAGRG